MQTVEMQQAMNTLHAFSEQERAYHRYQARQDYLRQQKSIEYHLGRLQTEKEHERAEKEAALAEKERERAEKEAALAEKEAALAEKEAALTEKEYERAEKEAALAEIARLKAR